MIPPKAARIAPVQRAVPPRRFTPYVERRIADHADVVLALLRSLARDAVDDTALAAAPARAGGKR